MCGRFFLSPSLWLCRQARGEGLQALGWPSAHRGSVSWLTLALCPSGARGQARTMIFSEPRPMPLRHCQCPAESKLPKSELKINNETKQHQQEDLKVGEGGKLSQQSQGALWGAMKFSLLIALLGNCGVASALGRGGVMPGEDAPGAEV